MILHVVLYQPRASATQEQLAELAGALEAASREIPSIRQVRVGRAIDIGAGYDTWLKDQNNAMIAIFEFIDEIGLKAYLSHPSHSRLAELFWNTSERTIILDASAVDPLADSLNELLVK